jgi:hypothetical protein
VPGGARPALPPQCDAPPLPSPSLPPERLSRTRTAWMPPKEGGVGSDRTGALGVGGGAGGREGEGRGGVRGVPVRKKPPVLHRCSRGAGVGRAPPGTGPPATTQRGNGNVRATRRGAEGRAKRDPRR